MIGLAAVNAVCDIDDLEERGFFSYGDLDTVIREDEGSVGRCQLSVRHFVVYCVIDLQNAGK